MCFWPRTIILRIIVNICLYFYNNTYETFPEKLPFKRASLVFIYIRVNFTRFALLS